MWQVERETILLALTWAGGDVTKAAAALEVGRTTLYRKIKGYEIRMGPWQVQRARGVGA